jgi:sigma-B regulation protein RsbU (phosphoserine phosphatase)
MDEQLNYAPCGFITLSKEGTILSINTTLLEILKYSEEGQVKGQHFHTILSNSARIFYQLYFTPLITTKQFVEEMYLSLTTSKGEEIPVLINASLQKNNEVYCIFVPMKKRNEFEEQLLHAKNMAEEAYREKDKAHLELQILLKKLEDKQQELLKLNQQNLKYKLETEKELQLAKKIQETALTQDIKEENIQILSHYHASKSLSGDIYGFYQINSHQYGIVLLDVMGHGISAALVTMSLQSLFHRFISKGVAAGVVMQELDHYLHNLFQNNQEAWHYCTAIYLNIDTSKQTVEFINAGHPPAIFQDPAGGQQELFATSPPLGSFEGITFKSKTLNYTKGTRILLYTDGVSEPFELNTLNDMLLKFSSSSLVDVKEKIKHTLQNKEVDFEKYNNDDQCFILLEL